MVESITLTVDGVIAKATEYYDNKKLTAQHPDREARKCTNFYGDYRCAVAASYPESWKEQWDIAGTFEQGLKKGYIKVELPEDIGYIARIQNAHDCWASASRNNYSEEAISRCKNHFLGLLSHPDYVLGKGFS